MDFEYTSLPSFEGTLLLASPALNDPNFARTVLLLVAHDRDEGAMGYILNRPLGKTVHEVLHENDEEDVGPLGTVPIYIGGPLGMSKLSFASIQWQPKKKQFKMQTQLSTEQALSHFWKGYEIRAYIGYSGWSEGQLESELEMQTWIQIPPVKAALSTDESLWSKILSEMGPYYRLVSMMPRDLSLN